MPGLVKRRFPEVEKLEYNPSRDIVLLRGGYRGIDPIVGVRSIRADPDIVQLSDLLSFDEVILSGDTVVKGNIFAEKLVQFNFYRGTTTVVIGDIGTSTEKEESGLIGKVVVGYRDAVEGRLFIHGNIMARSVEINVPTVMIGNIVALDNISVNAPSLIIGRIVVGTDDNPGKATLSNMTVFQVYVRGDVEVGPGVTVMLPLVVARNEEVKLKADTIRVLNLPCLFCTHTENPFLCQHYIEGSCPLEEKGLGYDYLAEYDLQKASKNGVKYSYISWYWRASPLMIAQNILSKKLLYFAYKCPYAYNIELKNKYINGEPHSTLPERFTRRILDELRRTAIEVAGETRRILFNTIEEYFKARNIPYVKCTHCGAPNPVVEKICIYCGKLVSE